MKKENIPPPGRGIQPLRVQDARRGWGRVAPNPPPPVCQTPSHTGPGVSAVGNEAPSAVVPHAEAAALPAIGIGTRDI